MASSLPSEVLARAREAAQDRGAKLGTLHTQPDAYALGESGLAAVRVVLNALDSMTTEDAVRTIIEMKDEL